MKNSSTTKFLNYFLYIGIAIHVLTTLINVLFPSLFIEDPQGPLLKQLANWPAVLVVFLILIFAPITEELIFRSWIKKSSAWKYVSFFGICIISYVAVESIIYLGFVALVLFYTLFILKNEKLRLALLVSFTSLFFGIVHCGNFSPGLSKILSILTLTGGGIILSYLGLRFRFIYCILGHFVMNLIFVLITLFASYNYSGEINVSNYTATIEKNASIKLFDIINYTYPDVINYEGSVASIACSLSEFSSDTIYRYNPTLFNNYKYKAVPKSGLNLSKRELFKDFVSYANLKLDTVNEKALILRIEDEAKLTDTLPPRDVNTLRSIRGFVKELREVYDLPLIINEFDSNYQVSLFQDVFHLFRLTKEEYLQILEQDFGLVVEEAPHRRAVIITISERSQ